MTTDKESKSNLRRLRSRPVCIISGRPAEAQRIAQALGIDSAAHRLSGDDVSMVKDGHTFYLGEFTLASGEKLKYYITSSLRMGIQSFTINAAILINILAPRFIIHTGVCAGFEDPTGTFRMNLCDVVFGEAAINYEEGKFEALKQGDVVFRPDYNRVMVEAGDMQAFADSRKSLGYHYGEYISGSAVRGDANTRFELIRSSVNRNAIALDMEASAFIQLCKHFEPSGPRCLGVIKGVSDFGNSEKGKDSSIYTTALVKTAAALEEWITHRILSINWEVDESSEPGAKLVHGYYENFVRRVIDNHGEGMEISYKHRPQEKIPTDNIKGFISVLPKNRDPNFVKELGQIQRTMSSYGVEEINIGRNTAQRYVYYKGGYFLDWCRTLNSLIGEEDAEYQVGVFERTMNKQPYYMQLGDEEPLARVLSWEKTMELLGDILKQEQEARAKTDAEAAKEQAKAIAEADAKHAEGAPNEGGASMPSSGIPQRSRPVDGTEPASIPAASAPAGLVASYSAAEAVEASAHSARATRTEPVPPKLHPEGLKPKAKAKTENNAKNRRKSSVSQLLSRFRRQGREMEGEPPVPTMTIQVGSRT